MNVFGIRHFSPAGAFFVRQFLDRHRPKLVLIEGPSDFDHLIEDIGKKSVKPPFAIMAYTLSQPVKTVLFPFSIYSPEYQAILWARENKVKASFFDLPSDILMNLEEDEKIESYESRENLDDFWDRVLEQSDSYEGYRCGAIEFGKSLRSDRKNLNRDLTRESYMRRRIQEAIDFGLKVDEIVMITGAFHSEALSTADFMRDEELKSLKRLEVNRTMMPYSYYRLTDRSGYAAGNTAPSYYEILWEGQTKGDATYHEIKYLTSLAENIRADGGIVSSAQVIEAVNLARSLAALRGSKIATIVDLKDAAVTCMGGGNFSELALAFARTDIGTKIGSVPKGDFQTSIQNDFNESLEFLKLEKYKSLTAQNLSLDLRENLRAKTEKTAFMDLNRSFFLHRLKNLGISFATLQKKKQDNATWAEEWVLQWTPEAEIQIVESVLKGNTIEQAVSFIFYEKLNAAKSVAEISEVISEAFYCNMPLVIENAIRALDEFSVDAISINDAAFASSFLSDMFTFGDIRKLDKEPLKPLIERLSLRGALIFSSEAICDDEAATAVATSIQKLHQVFIEHNFLDYEIWKKSLLEVAYRDDVNTKLSGLCMSILLDISLAGSEDLTREVSRRLSSGMPADLGAGWFEGLAMKNSYALIARISLWESLANYIDELDTEEFKRSLLFLRRAFSGFDATQKDMIAENLGEIWGIVGVSEEVNKDVSKSEIEVADIEGFDFDDF